MRKQFNNKLAFDYILDAINSSDYGLEKQPETDKEKLQFVVNTFEAEFGNWNKRSYPNLQNRFAEYLKGLPTCINIDFENYKILEIAEKWESIPKDATENQRWKIINNWFNFISAKFLQLCRKHKIDLNY